MARTVILDDRHLAAAQELRAVMAEEKALDERKIAAKLILAEVLTTIGQDAVDENGEVFATVRAGARRFNAEEAKRNLPPAALKMVTVEMIDPLLAKELLPSSLYELCTKQGSPTIVAA